MGKLRYCSCKYLKIIFLLVFHIQQTAIKLVACKCQLLKLMSILCVTMYILLSNGLKVSDTVRTEGH